MMNPTTNPLPLSAHDVRRVAVAAAVDPRTVVARLRGERMKSTTTARVDAALRELGFAVELPPQQAA